MNSFRPAIYISAILISILLITYAIYVFPIPGTDSMVFMPPALSFANNEGMTNHIYYVASFTDTSHSNRFNYYVPFFPMALGWLSRIKPDIRTIFFICSLFSITGLMLYARTIASYIKEPLSKTAKTTLVLTFTFLAMYLLPTVGRPENFSGLFVFLIFLLYHKKEDIHPALYYTSIIVLFSVLFATQIIGLFFCFLFYALFEILASKQIIKTAAILTILFAAIAGGFCTILTLSPHGLTETINAIGWHIALALNRADHSLKGLLYYWVYAPLSFGFVAIFGLATVFFVSEVREKIRNASVIKIVFAAIVLLLLCFGFFKYVLNAAPTVYNATQFILPLMTYIGYNLLSREYISSTKIATTTLLITCFAGTLLCLRTFILFTDMVSTGRDFASARAIVNSYTRNNKKVITSNGIWPIFENIKKPFVTITDQFEHGDTIVLQQAYFSYPEYITNKCTVLYDWRSKEPVSFMGIKLANHPYGYGFVIFKTK